jgi:hypothetical protein
MNETERQIRSVAGQMQFEPGFSDRVLARVRELESGADDPSGSQVSHDSPDPLYSHLRRVFPRLAAACVIGLLALGALALSGDTGLAGSPVDALLGLPAETLETAFALGGM